MAKKLDLTGKKFSRWTISEHSKSVGRRVYWWCLCECGKNKWVISSNLTDGSSQSCGCLRDEINRDNLTKSVRTTDHPLYGVWQNIKQRCTNPNTKSYKYYGEKGINICKEWLSFERFVSDVGTRPVGAMLNRKDLEKGYDKNNCFWSDRLYDGKLLRNCKQVNNAKTC